MITGKKEQLDQYVDTHRCPEHDNPLVVAWHAVSKDSQSQLNIMGRAATPSEVEEGGFWVIRCGAGHFPEEIITLESRTQLYKWGQLEKADPLFNLLPRTDLATGELLPPEMLQFLVEYARRYDLDPYRGHVVIMYGKPYIGLDGYLYHANQQKVPYELKSRPLTTPERADYQIKEGDHAWQAVVSINKGKSYYTGLGVVTQQEMTEMSKKDRTKLRSPVVAAHPWQLAQKRAEWQAMRRGFPIGETEEVNE